MCCIVWLFDESLFVDSNVASMINVMSWLPLSLSITKLFYIAIDTQGENILSLYLKLIVAHNH